MKYQNRFGMASNLTHEDPVLVGLRKTIEKLYKEQGSVEDIQSLTLFLYNLVSGTHAEYALRKSLEIRKEERGGGS